MGWWLSQQEREQRKFQLERATWDWSHPDYPKHKLRRWWQITLGAVSSLAFIVLICYGIYKLVTYPPGWVGPNPEDRWGLLVLILMIGCSALFYALSAKTNALEDARLELRKHGVVWDKKLRMYQKLPRR